MTTEDHVEQPERPMAWGQFAVGGVIGGIALWSIAMHVFGVTPSALSAGVAAAYESWRDWLLTPLLNEFDIELSPLNRDILAYTAVMAGAWIRTALRYPQAWADLFDLFFWPSLATAFVFYATPDLWSPSFGVEFWVSIVAVICTLRLLLRPAVGLAASALLDEHTAAHLGELSTPMVRFGLWNALAIFAFATLLLTLDWAAR